MTYYLNPQDREDAEQERHLVLLKKGFRPSSLDLPLNDLEEEIRNWNTTTGIRVSRAIVSKKVFRQNHPDMLSRDAVELEDGEFLDFEDHSQDTRLLLLEWAIDEGGKAAQVVLAFLDNKITSQQAIEALKVLHVISEDYDEVTEPAPFITREDSFRAVVRRRLESSPCTFEELVQASQSWAPAERHEARVRQTLRALKKTGEIVEYKGKCWLFSGPALQELLLELSKN